MIEHDGCEMCKHFNAPTYMKDSPCFDCISAHKQRVLFDKFEPITNEDKIKAMSDEELVRFLIDVELGKYKFTNHAYPLVKAMAFVQSEVKENEE